MIRGLALGEWLERSVWMGARQLLEVWRPVVNGPVAIAENEDRFYRCLAVERIVGRHPFQG